MEPARTFAILPGEGIGPFRLGMTRAQVRGIAQGELGFDVDEGTAHDAIGDTGLTIHYDANGCCSRLSALFGNTPQRYAFTLFGNDICGAVDTYVIGLCQHWPDVTRRHGGIDVPSTGFSDDGNQGTFEAAQVRACDQARRAAFIGFPSRTEPPSRDHGPAAIR